MKHYTATIAACLSASCALLALPSATQAEAVLHTEAWRNNDGDFARFHERIAALNAANLLARDGAKIAESGGVVCGTREMLTDGSAGVRVGKGRVGIGGNPATVTFYLGEPKAIREVGVFSNNSDARVNQDYEVRFANNSECAGEKPAFKDEADLTTGELVLGNNSGGFHSCFRAAKGGDLAAEKVDWVQFRFWQTYNVKAGSPAKDKGSATSWTSLIEIEILGDSEDVVATPAYQAYHEAAEARVAARQAYRKQATWQETMRVTREALMQRKLAPAAAGFRPFKSLVIRGGKEATQVRAKVSGVHLLWLTAGIGGDNNSYDQAVWGEPKLIAADGTVTDLSELKPAYARVGYGELLLGKGLANGPLQVAQRKFSGGFLAHAPSRLCFVLGGEFEWFESWVGIDATAGNNGSAQFQVTDRPPMEAPRSDLWSRLAKDFAEPSAKRQMQWEREDRVWEQDWLPGDFEALAQRYVAASQRSKTLAALAAKLVGSTSDADGLQRVRDVYHRTRKLDEVLARVRDLPFEPLHRAINDLAQSWGNRYPKAQEYFTRLATTQQAHKLLVDGDAPDSIETITRVEKLYEQFVSLKQEALLANPLLDFDRLLMVRRSAGNLGLPANWQGNCSLPRNGFDNEIAVFSPVKPEGAVTSLYRPKKNVYVGEVDLHFDADRMLFSSIGANGRWQIFEVRADGTGLRQVTRGEEPDVDHYDACYLPDGKIIFSSTASFTGVPCVYGNSHVAMLYRMEPDGSGVRQLCFEQDHDWYPAVLNNGRVLYARWEYTDTPHSQTRLLMHMNPDGTSQMEYYGSNSLWPNSIFYARPIPNHPTRVVAVISGHHGVPRMGELILFDPALGRHEAQGVVQRIPGYGKKVEPIVRDGLVNGSWPKFLHPYPLSEKYFLVSAKPTPKSEWGLYLVDVFDNLLLLREEPGYALLEPVPFRKTKTPPVIADRVQLDRKDAVMHVADVYIGDGLKGIPRGTVKELRIFTYHFAYQGMGGLLGVVGMDGPWDIKRVLGTVPVEEDGSATFRVPANTPLSVQPLDSEGKALQLMRSWMTAMPGETLSCVGCHESQNSAAPPRLALSSKRVPSEIQPWHGPTRGFSYPREVQPVIDEYCVGCHNGTPREDGRQIPNLRGDTKIKGFGMTTPGNGGGHGGKFSVGYAELHRYVRRAGIESDYHLLPPMEFHADSTELVQMLRKGHHNVQLDKEAWDRLITWIDLNAPYHGTWHEEIKDPGKQRERRRELRKRYAGIDEDPEAVIEIKQEPVTPVIPAPLPDPRPKAAKCPDWPFDAAEARKRQRAAGPAVRKTLDLGGEVKLDLVLVPAGEFLMGDREGHPDERPVTRAKIEKPFWVGRCEISNEQYARFDPAHDSHVESKNTYQFGVHGYPLDRPQQPVVRISWRQAVAFCEWLSEETGMRFSLPTEAQWEYACRAGSGKAFSFGDLAPELAGNASPGQKPKDQPKPEAGPKPGEDLPEDDELAVDDEFAPEPAPAPAPAPQKAPDGDFSEFANLADAKLKEFASNPYTVDQPLPNPTRYDDWTPKETRFNDGGLVTVDIGSYLPNAWGLHDMHGNVWEWTRTSYQPYPYRGDDGRNSGSLDEGKVVRGGSWRDRPKRCRSAFRLSYRTYQVVHNVGFRVVCEVGPAAKAETETKISKAD